MNNKTILFAAGVVLLAASVFTFMSVNRTNDPRDDLFEANVEALARNETNWPKGRWRTVGCGGYGFHQWKTYCCPSDIYDNCPGPGTCTSDVIFGCN